jgi:hypothetical protein
MSISTFSASVVGMILVLVLSVWAILSFSRKYRHMSWLWILFYILLFCLPGVGPIPILLLLHFNWGISHHVDPYFSHSTSHTPHRNL